MAMVRPEQPGDAAAIHALHAASFPTEAEARLVSLLRAPGHLPVSLLAEVDGALVGPGGGTGGNAAIELATLPVEGAQRKPARSSTSVAMSSRRFECR